MRNFKRKMLDWFFKKHDGRCGGHGGKGYFRHHRREKRPLLEVFEGEKVRIFFNTNKQILGMGMYPGMEIYIIKNDKEDTNIIVGMENSRFMVAKEIAREIIVM